MIATAQTTRGSVANIDALRAGKLVSALVQADVAYWAYRGERLFKAKGPLKSLRLIANLYPEALHVVVRKSSNLRIIGNLRGQRVSLGPTGSGTLVDARLVLAVHGLDERSVRARHLRIGAAVEALKTNQIDALMLIAGAPVPAVASLADTIDIALVPINGRRAEATARRYPFFSLGVIPGGTYKGVDTISTLRVGALWVVSAKADPDLVYRLTRALWNPKTLALLARGHPQGRHITLDTALEGAAIPLHPGAARFYRGEGSAVPAKPK